MRKYSDFNKIVFYDHLDDIIYIDVYIPMYFYTLPRLREHIPIEKRNMIREGDNSVYIKTRELPLIAQLYLDTIEEYENKELNSEYIPYRNESIYCYYRIIYYNYHYNNTFKLKVNVSDKVADSIVADSICSHRLIYEYECVWDYAFEFAQMGIIRSSKHANIIATELFKWIFIAQDSSRFEKLVYILQTLLDKELLDLTNFVIPLYDYFNKFISSEEFRRRSKLLLALKKHPIYNECAKRFDLAIRNYNIKEFKIRVETYRSNRFDEYDTPNDFKCLPFTDGSRMIPKEILPGWSWVLKDPTPKSKPVTSNEGCYIATCVYGSYDCPEVMILREYRDKTLSKSSFGKFFIKIYYSISPTLVKHFGNHRLFKKIWKTIIDRIINRLKHFYQ